MSPETASIDHKNRPSKPAADHRLMRAVGRVLAVLVVLLLLWTGAQVALRAPKPALLYTEADFAKLPTPEDNGWEVLRTEMGALGELQRPDKEIIELCDGKATFTDRWSRAEGRASKLAAIAADEKAKSWIALAEKAGHHARFADACPVEIDPKCPRPVQLLALHQVQEATILHDALQQQWEKAFSRATELLRVDIEFLPSARSTFTVSVARANVHRAITLLSILLDGVDAAAKQNQGPEATKMAQWVKNFAPLLKSIREEHLSPMRAVIAEYVYSAYTIDHIIDVPQGRFSNAGRLYYDVGHTFEMLNDRFQAYVAFAQRNGAGDPPTFSQSRLRYLRNPVGHLVLDGTSAQLGMLIPMMVKDRELLLADRNALYERIRPLITAQ